MPNNELIPSYLETDYNTLQTRLKTLMENSDTFKDYNYEGSNISMLIEMFSYLGDLSTYYTNLLAKNGYEDTADVYEAVHRIVKAKGYQPKGYISGQTTLEMTVTGQNSNDQIYIQPWQTIDTGLTTTDENTIVYSFVPKTDVEPVATCDASGTATISIDMREGEIVELIYEGSDLIDNQLILPLFNYDYGAYPYDVENVQVEIKNPSDQDYVGWDRVFDFYEELTGLTEEEDDNVYQFNYDKYKRYIVEFSSSRRVPSTNASIRVTLLKSNGIEGIIDKDAITSTVGMTISNNTQVSTVALANITATNTDVAQGAADPEVIDDMKNNSKGVVQSQLRNITKNDYKTNLESRTDISVANAWGEQEINPGQPLLFNKIYFSVIPPLKPNSTLFQTGTLETSAINWNLTAANSPVSGYIQTPESYNSAYEGSVILYLEPRKSINVYEEMSTPTLTYFMFELGIRIKRSYIFTAVQTDLLNKLEYYFNFNFRQFGETIDFMELHNFLLDPSETSPTDEFTNIRGIDNLVFRDVNTYTTGTSAGGSIHDPVAEPTEFPQFDRSYTNNYYDNTMRNIVLRYDQFPMLSSQHCVIINEG